MTTIFTASMTAAAARSPVSPPSTDKDVPAGFKKYDDRSTPQRIATSTTSSAVVVATILATTRSATARDMAATTTATALRAVLVRLHTTADRRAATHPIPLAAAVITSFGRRVVGSLW